MVKSNLGSPFFSVVTVCRNAAPLLAPTIDSLTNQTFQDFEYLVVDGASTDNSVALVENYAAGLSLRVVSEPDSGIYDAMNKGIRLACGQWVYFLNAGDQFANHSVLQQVAERLVESAQVDIAFGDVIYCGETGQRLVRFDWLNRNNLLFESLCHQAVFAKRTTFDRFGVFDTQYSINADYDWLIRTFRRGAGTTYLGFTIALYDDMGFSAREYKRLRSERVKVRAKYLPLGLSVPMQLAYRAWRKLLRATGFAQR